MSKRDQKKNIFIYVHQGQSIWHGRVNMSDSLQVVLIENKNDCELKKAKQCVKIFCECEEYQITRGPWTATPAWINVEEIGRTIKYKKGANE